MFEQIIDQDQALTRLLTLFRKDTMPHALLFTGIDGIGKKTAAHALAMTLNCPRSIAAREQTAGPTTIPSLFPCGGCRSCRKITTGVHPDILHVAPSGNLIKIAQIRELGTRLLIRPNEARMRVVIIDDAHTMNPESANALLKSLEEPPAGTMFVLITHQASDLLPTILSRCQQVTFNPITRRSIETCLIEKGMTPDRATALAAMADGSLGRAMALSRADARGGAFSRNRQWIAGELDALAGGSVLTGLLFAEKLASKKDDALQSLEFMTALIRDLVIYKISPDKILNRDLVSVIDGLSRRFSIPSLLSMNAHIQRAHKDILANAALRLSLEAMAFNLSRV
ncbi:DNA polymerase III subunit delta' [Desulfatiferula olefinivorans]